MYFAFHPQQQQQQLSKQSIAQRTRREREKQLREVTTVPQLFDQGVTNHSLASTSRNLVDEFNIVEFKKVSSQPPHTLQEESSTLLLDSITILEEQPCIMHSPNIPYPIMCSMPNFPSGTFKIGESSSARVNVVHHEVEAVYYNPIESDDECNIDDEDNDNVNEVDKGNINGKIRVPNLNALHNEFHELYDDNELHSRSFRRELHHRIGALVPNEEQEASYAHLYIYNPGASLNTHHKRNLHLNRDVLKVIQDTLVQCNPFSEFYYHAYEVLEDVAGDNKNFNVPAYLHYSVSKDHHRYNFSSIDDIAVILPRDGSEISGMRDVIVYRKANQGLIQISECHPAYLPMHYVLLYPTGQLG
ncbi:hypothetical protein GIB67_000090 [Kingdonia uniflora]|uniref:Uncharacterized protein n=1 Tax=Kingdonia uniflora TaxID=39325 RepID=A0A7J7M5S0_9MAGN|nr:hypothetical protein GIB67_000090 [Kingdonia uniflora]